MATRIQNTNTKAKPVPKVRLCPHCGSMLPGVTAMIDASVELSLRQTEILRLVAQGKTNREIAEMLEISRRTVEFHRMMVLEKLDARSTADLVLHAAVRKLI